MSWFKHGEFVHTGTPYLSVVQAALTSTTGAASTGPLGSSYGGAPAILALPTAYSNHGFHCTLLTGAGTSGTFQLLGGIGATSDANASLRPLTTYDLSANTSDDVLWITGKPVNRIAVQCTTPSSSGTFIAVMYAGTP